MSNSWKLERHIPLAIIGALLFQSATAIWWAATVESRLSEIESKVARQLDDSARLIRIEERLHYLSEHVKEFRRR